MVEIKTCGQTCRDYLQPKTGVSYKCKRVNNQGLNYFKPIEGEPCIFENPKNIIKKQLEILATRIEQKRKLIKTNPNHSTKH